MDKLIDYVGIYENCLDSELCENLISIGKTKKYSISKMGVNDIKKDTSVRMGTEVLLTHTDHTEIRDNLISATVSILEKYQVQTKRASQYIKENFDTYKLENFRIRKYPKGSGFFKVHSDITDYKSASRLLVVLLYLNDVVEGGETEFPSLGIKIKPSQGLGIVFPPTFLFPHQANIPISNSKYTTQTYLHYK
jgi:flagellar biosynthesis regulator FlaF